MTPKDSKYWADKGLSNSNMGYLNISPRLFVRMKENLEESPKKYFDMGSAFHCMVLEPENFNEDYIVEDVVKPKSKQQSEFVALIINQGLNSTEAYSKIYSVSNKTDEAIEKEASELYTKLDPYIKFLIRSESRVQLSLDDYMKLQAAENSAREHKRISKLLFEDPDVDEEHFVEMPIYFKYRGVNCKAKLDKFIINKNDRYIKLIDVKTTSKGLNKFRRSFDIYDYDRQLAFYLLALQTMLEDDLSDWDVEVLVIATDYNESAVYRISKDDLERGKIKYDTLIDKYLKHLKYGFDYPVEYYEGDGTIDLLEE